MWSFFSQTHVYNEHVIRFTPSRVQGVPSARAHFLSIAPNKCATPLSFGGQFRPCCDEGTARFSCCTVKIQFTDMGERLFDSQLGTSTATIAK